MSDYYTGEIRLYAGIAAPGGWALCDGRALSIAQYQNLFALIGTSYGGDGSMTFCLPDLRGRLPIGQGAGPGLTPRVLAATGGTEGVALVTSDLPAHSHGVMVSTSTATSVDPQGAAYASLPETTPGISGLYTTATGAGSSPQTFGTGTLAPAGGNLAHPNLMSSIGINFIIALNGIVPNRPKA